MTLNVVSEYIRIQSDLVKKYGENSITLYMIGSFYEMYGSCKEDLDKVTKILNISLTRKNKSDDNSPYMCGFPDYSVSKHLSKLIEHKYTVAIYDQQQDKTVRECTQIVSPGTFMENGSDLMCVYVTSYKCPLKNIQLNNVCICSIDLTTGQNRIGEYCDQWENQNVCEHEIHKWINTIQPSEIIMISPVDMNIQHPCLHDRKVNKTYQNHEYQTKFLEKVFGKHDLVTHQERIGLHTSGELLYCYIEMLQFAYEHNPHIISQIKDPISFKNTKNMYMNNDSITQLHLFSPLDTSLYSIMNKTKTKMGARLLKERFIHPITSPTILQERYDKIEKSMDVDVRNTLTEIVDIEKKWRKLQLHTLQSYEFANVLKSFPYIHKAIELFKDICTIPDLKIMEFYNTYTSKFNIQEMEYPNSTQYIRDNKIISSLLDQINIITSSYEQIQQKLMDVSGGRAAIKIVNKDEMYFTTTKKCWTQLQTNSTCFTVCEKQYDMKDIQIQYNKTNVKIRHPLTTALHYKKEQLQQQLEHMIEEIYKETLQTIQMEHHSLFTQIIQYISEIDIISTSCFLAKKYNYCKPNITSSTSFVKATGIRHPIIERICTKTPYTKNDITLSQSGILLYGLNSSGKSSLLRTIGTNIVLAQVGMYVNSDTFEYYPFQRCITKIATTDDMFRGQSTFIVEMNELREILNTSDKNTLILCDELTSGTETHSATAIVASTILSLLERKVNFVCTTHLHGLMKFKDITSQPDLHIFHFKVQVKNGKLICNRKLEKGSGETKYGIEIASAMGLPTQFIKMAYSYRNQFEDKDTQLLTNKRSRYNKKVIMDECKHCGNKKNLHTHHIEEQHTASSQGMVPGGFHKNIEHNLMVLCEECHKKVHS